MITFKYMTAPQAPKVTIEQLKTPLLENAHYPWGTQLISEPTKEKVGVGDIMRSAVSSVMPKSTNSFCPVPVADPHDPSMLIY